MRRKNAQPFTSPVLIGAVTVLAVLIAVLLAYKANQGLPFVPTKELKVDVSDGSNITVGNDVREGGFLVGLVSAERAVLVRGRTVAQLTLKLSESHARVPVDSVASVDSKSVLGLKYVAIRLGRSGRVFADGATLPVSQSAVPVQFDQVLDTFNAPTRRAVDRGLVGFGDALAGRGGGLNDTFVALPSLLSHLDRVAGYLSAPSAGLVRFFDALNGFTSTVDPVSGTLARLLGDQGTTFGAISRSPRALESTIQKSPGTLSVSTGSLRVQQPFLADFASLGRALEPASVSLRRALPVIDPALEQGSRVLGRTPVLDRRLQGVMGSLQRLALAPGTNVAVNALAHTVGTLNPMIRYLGPYVTVCNDWNYWWSYLAGDVDEATSFGYAQRALFEFGDPLQPNDVGSVGATAPADGGGPGLLAQQFLHDPSYGAAVDSHGNADCENGQRGYPLRLNSLDPRQRNLDMDPHTPGDQGPTFTGLTRVPKGETFSRNPTTGPQLPPDPANP
jgi:virulence factor Mce-like protein